MRAFAAVSLLLLLACACSFGPGKPIVTPTPTAAPAQEPGNTADDGVVRWKCDTPRPTRCPTTDAPVCADSGSEFRNWCYACRDTTVSWYFEGACSALIADA